MKIRVHPCARTTPAAREERQQNGEGSRALAQQCGLARTTVQTWCRRDIVKDRSHCLPNLQNTLRPTHDGIAVYRRQHLLLLSDDLLAVTRQFLNPAVSRSGLDGCLRRHRVATLTALRPAGEFPVAKPFKVYEPGLIHVDVKYLPAIDGEPLRNLSVAIDRAARCVYVALKPNRTARSAKRFLKTVIHIRPFRNQNFLFHNPSEFIDRSRRTIPEPTWRWNASMAAYTRFYKPIASTPNHGFATTLSRYVDRYNHHIPQPAPYHQTPNAKRHSSASNNRMTHIRAQGNRIKQRLDWLGVLADRHRHWRPPGGDS